MIAEEIQKRIYTVDEYLEFEKNSEVKHEFVDGILLEMPGESKKANIIAGSIYMALRLGLKGKPFEVYNHDVKLRTVPGRKYRYPDIMVVPTDDVDDTHVVHRAIVTVEVTSENSSGVDHDEKFHEYIGIPSIECYLIVSQAELLVEVYQRTGTKWEYAFYTDLTDSFDVRALGITMQVGDVYEGVF
ncbi:Uma2 family endonuclease [Spirosoma sp. KCTC 42546]|uniref:Uma2 family endonuclease n=1 Tax=Spirosoma sp. KCTC 42546 TaxID=2520506 RepID=UPI0011591405|nr:Uma2 family endonuclease [Spirosoma sp. KCTC 42546]QDK79445.1 Uma2 family endonuclease [Spirosoma sp. KCTC 42546]